MVWYKMYFDDFYLERIGLKIPESKTKEEIDFFIKHTSIMKGAKILDLCCGHGRHSIELAKRGFSVIGVDLSEHYLSVAREKAKESDVEVEFINRDMRDLSGLPKFDAAICMNNSFGYLESYEEECKVIRALSDRMKQGADVFFELPNRERMILNKDVSKWDFGEDGTLVVRNWKFDVKSGKCYQKMSSISTVGERKDYSMEMRYFAYTEIETLLAKEKIVIDRSFGSFIDGEDYELESKAMILLTRKVSS